MLTQLIFDFLLTKQQKTKDFKNGEPRNKND